VVSLKYKDDDGSGFVAKDHGDRTVVKVTQVKKSGLDHSGNLSGDDLGVSDFIAEDPKKRIKNIVPTNLSKSIMDMDQTLNYQGSDSEGYDEVQKPSAARSALAKGDRKGTKSVKIS
jgi:hypothetical protein